MLEAPFTKGTSVARMACLLAIAPPVGVILLVLGNDEPSPWFVALVAALVATTLRVTLILPHGDEAVFALLWLALGVTLGITVLGALSVGPAFLITLMMLVLAIATAPNRTGRSRAHWPYLALQAAAFFAVIALPLLAG